MQNSPSTLTSDEIRILEYDATLSRSLDALACRTMIITLSKVNSDTDSYAALSYVWGDPTMTKPIICDGVTLSVTSNLRNALSTLWKAQPSTRVWADAISINQKNLAERSHQVSLMGDIYQSASTVFVYLGPSLRGGNRLWALFQSFELTGSLDSEEFDNELDDITDGRPNKLAMGLYDLFQRPWFRRAWTYQEICLASTAVAICGDSFMPWNNFVESLNALKNAVNFLPGFEALRTFVKEQEVIFRIPSALVATKSNNANSKTHSKSWQKLPKQPLLDLLIDTWPRDASDARDKIYAYTSPKLTSTPYLELRADYNLNIWHTFIRFVRVYINNENNLNFLKFARGIGELTPGLEPDLLGENETGRWIRIEIRGSRSLTKPPPTYQRTKADLLSEIFGHATTKPSTDMQENEGTLEESSCAEILPSWICDWRMQGMQKRDSSSCLMSSNAFSDIRVDIPPQRQSIHDFSQRLVFKGLALARVSDDDVYLGAFLELPTCALEKALVHSSSSTNSETTPNTKQPLVFRKAMSDRNPPYSDIIILLLHAMLHDQGACSGGKCRQSQEPQNIIKALCPSNTYQRFYVCKMDWLFILDGFDEPVILRPHIKPSTTDTGRSEVGFDFVSVCPLRINAEREKWLDIHCAYGKAVMF